MRLNFQVLTYFLAIANEESITAACEVLHVTQPTVSRQISDLEKDLGVVLFERGPRKITLTKEGILFKRRAEEILSLINITEEEIARDSQELEGTITIGGGELKTVDYVCEKMAEFQKLYPKVFFNFNTTTSDIIKDQMDKVEPSDLLNENIILPRRSNIKNELSSWFGKDITKLNIVATHNLNSNTAVMVSKNVGTALTIETELINSFYGIKVLKLKPELTARTVVAWKKNIPMNSATTRFIEFLRE